MVENIPHASQFIWLIQHVLHIHCWYKHISIHATMKHLSRLTEWSLTTLLRSNIRWSWITTLHSVNPHCSVPEHCFYYEAESEQLLHGLSMLPTKVECCPPAHEVRETQWNLMGLTYVSTSSVPHELVYIRTCTMSCADNKRLVTLMIHT